MLARFLGRESATGMRSTLASASSADGPLHVLALGAVGATHKGYGKDSPYQNTLDFSLIKMVLPLCASVSLPVKQES